jgi:hypothetical protein
MYTFILESPKRPRLRVSLAQSNSLLCLLRAIQLSTSQSATGALARWFNDEDANHINVGLVAVLEMATCHEVATLRRSLPWWCWSMV